MCATPQKKSTTVTWRSASADNAEQTPSQSTRWRARQTDGRTHMKLHHLQIVEHNLECNLSQQIKQLHKARQANRREREYADQRRRTVRMRNQATTHICMPSKNWTISKRNSLANLSYCLEIGPLTIVSFCINRQRSLWDQVSLIAETIFTFRSGVYKVFIIKNSNKNELPF